MKKGVNAYQQVGIKDQIATADPHQIIQMLMQGGLDRMAQAKGAIERKDYAAKSEHLSRAIAIVSALRDSVKPVPGAEELTDNLVALYDFITERLQEASNANDAKLISDASSVLSTVKEGWDAIPQDERQKAFSEQQMSNSVGAAQSTSAVSNY